jgi:hypothetical protein
LRIPQFGITYPSIRAVDDADANLIEHGNPADIQASISEQEKCREVRLAGINSGELHLGKVPHFNELNFIIWDWSGTTESGEMLFGPSE